MSKTETTIVTVITLFTIIGIVFTLGKTIGLISWGWGFVLLPFLPLLAFIVLAIFMHFYWE